MNWMTLFEIAVNIFEGGLFAYFGRSAFPPKGGRKGDVLYSCLIWLSSTLLLTFFIYEPPSVLFLDMVIILVIFSVLTVWMRTGTAFHRIFWSAVYFAMVGCVIYAVMTIALSLPDVTPEFLLYGKYGRILYVLVTNGALLSMTFIMIPIVRKSKGLLNIKVIAVSTALIVTNLFVLFILIEYTAAMPQGVISPILLIVSSVALLVVNTLVIWMFQYINKQNEAAVEIAASEQRAVMQARHQGEIGQIEQDLRKFRHDSHSHFQYLLMQLESRQTDAAIAYLRDLSEELDDLALVISTGNAITDAILNVKAHIAEHDHVHFDVEAMLPPDLPISDNDLVIILGNLLDNAIEACTHLPDEKDRVVRVLMRINRNLFIITVENKMVHLPQQKGLYTLTSKRNTKLHGLGLRIIRDHVEEYGGSVDIKKQDGIHEISLIFPI